MSVSLPRSFRNDESNEKSVCTFNEISERFARRIRTFFSLLVHFFTVLCETKTSLSKDDIDNSENVVKKRDFGLIHSFLDHPIPFGYQNVN